jgi:Ca2+-binding RTX toxin-like protein
LNIENLTGSNFNDSLSAVFPLTDNGTLSGGAGIDSLFTDHATGFTLNGDTDNDSLLAVESFDITLNGGTGNDRLETADGLLSTLNGGDGNDVLVVSLAVGASTMNGGAGADTLQCDFGSDTICDYNAVSDSPVGAGRDKINGFNGDFHRIDLTTIDAIPGGADNAFTYIGSAAFTAAGQLRYNTTTGILSGSTDGDTAAEFEIQLVGAPGLTVGGADTDILL